MIKIKVSLVPKEIYNSGTYVLQYQVISPVYVLVCKSEEPCLCILRNNKRFVHKPMFVIAGSLNIHQKRYVVLINYI